MSLHIAFAVTKIKKTTNSAFHTFQSTMSLRIIRTHVLNMDCVKNKYMALHKLNLDFSVHNEFAHHSHPCITWTAKVPNVEKQQTCHNLI